MEWYWILLIVVGSIFTLFLLSVILYKPFFKRFWDVVLSLLALLVFSWLFIILTIVGAIAMRGNPFFVQKRPGKRKRNGEERIFGLVKFRTMTNAKDKDGNLLSDEKRLNGYGKFLRSTSLDELPEAINIFLGHMSVVGPRPLLVSYLDYYTPFERHRHDVRPGLTGYAQIHGRNDATWEDKFLLDVKYVNNYSFLMDLSIVFKTFFMMLKGSGVEEAKEEIRISSSISVKPIDAERKGLMKEVGSSFWVSPSELEDTRAAQTMLPQDYFKINGADSCWTSTGRSAIELVIKNAILLNKNLKKVAVLPTFSCESVYEPFFKNGFEIRQYSVNKQFEITSDLSSLIDGAGLLLIHPYFGFNSFSDQKLIARIKKKGVVVIEDLTQCLFSSFEFLHADYWIGSVRKWLGVPDGGFVISSVSPISNKPSIEDSSLESVKVDAEIRKYNYLMNGVGDKTSILERFKEAEDILDGQNKVYSISRRSLKLLLSFDRSEMSSKRRSNYEKLSSTLIDKKIEVFDRLPKDVVPLYFPIYLSNRGKLQSYLSSNNIYAPIIWPKEGILGSSDYDGLYECLLAIPIDQRYSEGDIVRVAKCINAFCKYGF